MLSLMNALISYQLTCRGEEYWWEFSRFFANSGKCLKMLECFREFLSTCRCNRLAVQVKLRRLEKILPFKEVLLRYLTDEDYLSTLKLVSRVYNTPPYAKTVAFSIKMGYYGVLALKGRARHLPPQIPIPVDRRISKITYKSQMVLASGWEELLKCPDVVVEAWFKVAEVSGIPPAHIDSLLWPPQSKETFTQFNSVLKGKLSRLFRVLGIPGVESGEARSYLNSYFLMREF